MSGCRTKFNKVRFIVFILLLFIFQDKGLAQIEITGFFDVVHNHNFSENLNNGFQINQFEIDISSSYEGHISLGTAIAYDPELDNLNLAMAFLHYNLIKGHAMHPRREEELEHFGIVVGKFDIHFGLDYLSFASPDRPVVSQPLVIEKTIGGWNDIGIGIHMMRKFYVVELWAVNGFSEGFNLGGNFRFNLLPSLKLGLSHASDFNNTSERTNWLQGVDLQFEWEPIEIKSEYLWTNALYEGDLDTLGMNNREGFYFQVLTELEDMIDLPLFFTLRYGFCQAQVDRDLSGSCDSKIRYTLGLGYNFTENCSARIEIRSDHMKDLTAENTALFQLVVAY